MTEPNHSDGTDASEKRALDRLIRAALERPLAEYERPTDDAITAYLLGVAEPEQQEDVQSALVSSPEFRAEMLEAARDLERLDSEAVGAAFEAATAPVAPDLRAFLGGQPPEARREKRPERRTPGVFREILDSLRPPWRVPVMAVAAAAAVAVILLIQPRDRVPFRSSGMVIRTTKWSLASDLFLRLNLRSGSGEEDIVEETVQDAAVTRFQEVIAYEDRRFLIRPQAFAPTEPDGRKGVVLRVLGQGGRELGRLAAAVPESATDVAAVVILLRAPSPKAYTVQMPSDSIEVRWTGAVPDSGAVTFVYGIDRRFGASRAVPFRFKRN